MSTVWVVEDSPLEAELARRVLGERHQLAMFGDAESMLEKLEHSAPPDVLVLDWNLPGISGVEACQFLRTRFDEVALPVLVLTALGSARGGTAVEGLSSGANDYLRKPYEPLELLARVGTLARIRQLAARAEAARRDAEEQRSNFEATFKHATVGIARLSLTGRFLQVNAAFERMVLRSAAELVGTEASAISHPDDRQNAGEVAAPLISGEVSSVEIEKRCVRGDGRVINVLISLALARDGEGRPANLIALTQDITAAKREQALRAVRAEFEKQLIGIVSHDLRTPLTAILLSVASLERRVDPARLEAGLTRIRASADRANRMVRDLLDFTQARLGSGLQLSPKPFDLRAHAQQVLEELRAAHPGRLLELTATGDAHGEWDADRIAQLITNLVANAFKYGDGDTPVRVDVAAGGAEVVLTVQNRGTPIPADALMRIFEPLQRGGKGIDLNGRSIGLGLYIVRAITEAHHGRVSVRSDATDGTAFSVALPRAVAA